MLKMEHRRCGQTKCGFYLNGGCRTCESCKAKSYDINTQCARCLRCESVPNELRWVDKKIQKDRDRIEEIQKDRKLIEEIRGNIEVSSE